MARTMAQVQQERDALRQQWQHYQEGMHEGGDGFNPHTAALLALEAEYERLDEAAFDVLVQAAGALEDAEWTCEITQERRTAWNAWVKAQGRTISPAQVAAAQQAFGFTMLQLAHHVKRHGV